jgi:hypothetical protein
VGVLDITLLPARFEFPYTRLGLTEYYTLLKQVWAEIRASFGQGGKLSRTMLSKLSIDSRCSSVASIESGRHLAAGSGDDIPA